MNPVPGSRRVQHVGDFLDMELHGVPAGWQARVRTTLGRAEASRDETVRAGIGEGFAHGAAWHDLPLHRVSEGVFRTRVALAEVGWFEAKAYAIDPRHFQHWPDGPNAGISVHPSWTRTGNTLYCAFPRQFGPAKAEVSTTLMHESDCIRLLDRQGFTVIPPSGTLRDFVRELPHVMEQLGCRIIHLLPVNPTPTTFARFGRFGSPYALQDLTAIDPALVEFDRRTTGVQQFEELTHEVHRRGGRVFLDLVINHTGWGSTLYENHPEWFRRHKDGRFESPGAWGNIWEDLVELDPASSELWEHIAAAFLTWCRRGVDGFRCDAGYKVPVEVWRHVTARVRQEFPDTVFLLEGLGGSWEATETLLTEGGMQWAYSELFQNYGGAAVHWYLGYALPASERFGIFAHYSETHDNARLASHEKGAEWSINRNRLCALTSVNGAFGFTNGVEWLATERVNVHSARGLAWGSQPNLVSELASLNGLLSNHPCFFDGAQLEVLSPASSPVLALKRTSAEGHDSVLVLVNNDMARAHSVDLPRHAWEGLGSPGVDLLQNRIPADVSAEGEGVVRLSLGPGAAHCLARSRQPAGLAGAAYREARARADWAIRILAAQGTPAGRLPDWRSLADHLDRDPYFVFDCSSRGMVAGATLIAGETHYRRMVVWRSEDTSRVFLVPPGHWLIIEDESRFRASLQGTGLRTVHEESVLAGGLHRAAFRPHPAADAEVVLERLGAAAARVRGVVRFLRGSPSIPGSLTRAEARNAMVLLTNGRGAMVRMAVDLGRIQSKYDCVLGANLHPDVPVDRHVFAKRLRVWVNADGFISQLDIKALESFEPGPEPHWQFIAPAGDGRSVVIHLVARMPVGENTVRFQFTRPNRAGVEPRLGRPLPLDCRVSLTVRLDIEDRGFHGETLRNPASEAHFTNATHRLHAGVGFSFTPAPERHLRVESDAGVFHQAAEWSMAIPHPIEASRGMVAAADAWSPGWFEIPMPPGSTATLTATAERGGEAREGGPGTARTGKDSEDPVVGPLLRAARAFVVARGGARTVIAGYPWFLDWGRDSLIAARGLLAGGLESEVRSLLEVFARFEDRGTLPNAIHGENASNRETSDAPLWFGMLCEEWAGHVQRRDIYDHRISPGGRTVADVLRSIACGYLAGTPNGTKVDASSGLVWSPGHFTWMDTNHPAGTPREGYPVEIQALWIRLLRQLAELRLEPWEGRGESWADLARRAELSLLNLFWLEEEGWLADCLPCASGHPARSAPQDHVLRPNCLFAVSLGLLTGNRARRLVKAARRYLLVPGALRSLAPLCAIPPLPIWHHGRLLNHPDYPYWGRYEGDEDTRRKPAYHNGTAWVWLLPTFCEALARAWQFEPDAVAAAKAYLASFDVLFTGGCVGQLPEIVDGDQPHTPRGCDAQAWSVTEVLRVWRLLS